MSTEPREELAALMRNLRSGGSFATRRTAPVHDLAIEVTGVGALELPVTAAAARQLRLVARPAKYGYGERTILDRTVRDTWEVPRSRVRIDKRRWNRTLRPMLAAIRDDLGLPAESSLDAQLHSMLLYEPGQFFAAHQDSEKDDQMIGTLLVLLPSRSTGGDLVVTHRGASVRYKGSTSSLTFVAFYGDTRHEVLPIETGNRVVLTSNLTLNGDTTPGVTDVSVAATAADLLDQHFARRPSPRWSGDRQALDPPDRLVVLLDHQYTERGLRWSHLKGDDAARAQVLRAAADDGGCEVALAQAEIHETSECYEDDPRSWRRRGWSDWDDDETDDEVGDGSERRLDVGDILESIVEIVPAAGETLRFDRAVSDTELSEVTPTAELLPYDSEYTGYMGNWGNTMDRWYRRAAIVLWPRTRAFAIRAKGDPSGALAHLLARTATDETSRRARRDDTMALLRFWPDAVRRGDQQDISGALQLAWDLGDEETATSLLEPFALEALSPPDAPVLVALTEQHGLEWFDRRLAAWLDQRRSPFVRSQPAPSRTVWVEHLPELSAGARSAERVPAALGTEIARRLLDRVSEWLIDATRQATLVATPSRRQSALAELALPTLAALRSAGIIGDLRPRDRVIEALRDADRRIVPMLVDVVAASAGLTTDELEIAGVGTIAQHCRQMLEAELAEPPRPPDDWSITEFEPGGCCPDCTTLDAFLTDPAAQQTTWPLAKPRRQHIHHRIDDAELSVTHRTVRQGSPHKLILTKTTELHRRDAERRRTATASLEVVEQLLTAGT